MSAEMIDRRICLIRDQKVMLDSDLAELYQVPTKVFNQAVKRHVDRFPQDFMFHLTNEEAASLRSQFVTLEENGRGGYSKYAPFAFTELGIAMLSSVLNSKRAVDMNILIMRAFVRLRELAASDKDLARKIDRLEVGQRRHSRAQQEHSVILEAVVKDVQRLKNPPITHAIGFVVKRSGKR